MPSHQLFYRCVYEVVCWLFSAVRVGLFFLFGAQSPAATGARRGCLFRSQNVDARALTPKEVDKDESPAVDGRQGEEESEKLL